MSENVSKPLPVVPMRNVVLFPGVTCPISAGRPGPCAPSRPRWPPPTSGSSRSRSAETSENVSPDDLYTIGTIATIGPVQRGLGGDAPPAPRRGARHRDALAPNKDGYLEAIVREASEMLPLDARRPGVRRPAPRGARARRRARQEAGPSRRGGPAGPRRGRRARPARRPRRRLHRRARRRAAGLLETLSVEDRLRRVLVHVQRQIGVLEAQEDIKSKVQEELGEPPARDVPARAAEGDPEGARRGRRRGRRRPRGAARRSSTRCRCPRRRARKSTASWPRLDAHRPRVDGVAGDPHLPRERRRAAVEHAERRAARRPGGRADPRRGPLRPRRREGPRARVPRRAPARRRAPRRPRTLEGRREGRRAREGAGQAPRQGPDPALRRPARRRQDLDREVDRPRDGAQVRPHLARRRARRGRHPRPPAHLRRRACPAASSRA